MASPTSNVPILLLPLKLETRFVKDELWIRAFPDGAFLQSHDPALTKEEIDDALAFKDQPSKEKEKQAWENLVSKYGVYRSSWIAQISREKLQQQARLDKKEEAPSFYFKWLPDRLVFYVYKKGDLKPTYKKDGSVIDRKGLTVLGERDDWLQDFNKAILAGMGIKIKIDPADTKFERVIVSGFRHDNNPLVPAQGLADLFANHQYTEGFSFLKYGTPTNNTENAKSGYSARDEFEVADSYEYAVTGLNLAPDAANTPIPGIQTETNGRFLGRSLGFDTDHLKHVRHADERPPILNELYQKASWFALGAQPLFMLFGNHISSAYHESICQHYSKYVKSRGLFAALKIGNQPYGILPAMNISNVLLPENKEIRESDQLFDKMTVIFALLMKRWVQMANGDQAQLPRLQGNVTHEDILKILSMQESSSHYQIRALEYHSFKKKMYDFLSKSSAPISSWTALKGMGGEYETVQENVRSLTGLFDWEETGLSEKIDQFLRAPLLSFMEGDAKLIAFVEGNSIVTDHQGNKLASVEASKSNFSFAEENLHNFQVFIDALREQKENELVQYRGDLSLFTDLFIRSYTNACQLYFREIVLEPEIGDSAGANSFIITTIEKAEGTAVAKGDPVISILGANSKNLTITAPFHGTIKKIWVKQNENIKPGMPLYMLLNETKFTEIKHSFIELGQEIINAIHAIPEGKERIDTQMKAIGEAVDLNSYRLDAWITSLAARTIDEIRSNPDDEKGIYFGAYGWVEDLEKDANLVNPESLTDIYREAGGIIHTPGAAQSVASSVFKNSFLAHEQEVESNPFTINLTSDRIQKSGFLLDGIRQGQQLEALLGYQLERHLHENNLHKEIYALREAFPLYENTTGNSTGFVNLSVIDGLKAIKNKESLPVEINGQVKEKVKKQIEKLEDTMDGSLDALFYEAGYQVTQGNLSQAAAALAATKGDLEPPVIESLKTKIPGTGIKHKLVMVFQPGNEQFSIENPKSFAEPKLENWLKDNLKPIEKLVCVVELRDTRDNRLTETVEINLEDLNITYLDFLYLSEGPVSDGASELELRIRNAVVEKRGNFPEETKYVITNKKPTSGQSLVQALEVARTAKSLLGKCRYLKSDDLTMESETIRYDHKGLDEIKDNRLRPLVERLKEISDLTETKVLKFLSNLDFESAKTAFLENTAIDTAKLKAAIESKIKYAEDLLSKYNSQSNFYRAFELLHQVAKILFGESFILLPPAVGSGNFNQIINSKKQHLLVGNPADKDSAQVWGQERIKNWIQGVAQVHENSELFEDWLIVRSVWSQSVKLSGNYNYSVVQGPTMLKYPWIALSKQEIGFLLEKQFASQPVYADPDSGETYPLPDGTYYPEGCESTVIYAPENLNLEKPVFGMVIDEFSEHIPDTKMNTGLSFNYNTPNAEPPQAILLAIHPKAKQEREFFWSEDDLRDIIYDTMDLYKIRMVDLEAIQEYGYVLPMTWWFNIPGNK